MTGACLTGSKRTPLAIEVVEPAELFQRVHLMGWQSLTVRNGAVALDVADDHGK